MNDAWPDVPVGEFDQMTCPIPGCGEELYLNRTYGIALTAQQDNCHSPRDAVSDYWEVECIGGHRIYNSPDQARAIGGDETSETAVEYDHLALHKVINQLGGERL